MGWCCPKASSFGEGRSRCARPSSSESFISVDWGAKGCNSAPMDIHSMTGAGAAAASLHMTKLLPPLASITGPLAILQQPQSEKRLPGACWCVASGVADLAPTSRVEAEQPLRTAAISSCSAPSATAHLPRCQDVFCLDAQLCTQLQLVASGEQLGVAPH